MKKLLLATLFGFALLPQAWAQATSSTTSEGFKITGRIKGLKDTTCVLAHYFGSAQYITKDTARVDGAGNMVFEGKKTLPQGLFLVVMPKKGYIEFLMTDDQEFSFETDTAEVIKNMKITGSKENEAFYGYQQQLGKLSEEAQALTMQKKVRNDAASVAMVNKQLSDLQKQATEYRTKFLQDNPGTFAVKLLKATAEPDVPPAPKAANGRPDSIWVFNYFKQHFWDDFDFSDERFVRTPILQRKIERYIKELTVQVPDSLIKEADFLVNKAVAGKNKEIKYYTIYYITSQYEQPKVMGTDGLFVHMFEKYYKTGVMTVSDSSTLKSIGERVATMKPNLIGKTLVSPVISDTLRRPIAFQAIKADYTVVFFYSPTCGHCRESAPKLKKFVDDYKGKGVEVVAIAIDQNPEEWKKFIKEFKLGNAINGYDYSFRTDYRHQYDVWTTPTVYVLDKDKKIIARKLPAEQIEDFMLFHKRQQATKKPVTASVKGSVKK
ncbi:TlpA family protein disulfide reductase [Spirosoma radiotolerans]|uniref:Alkyl hydroperoxide reductase n=1 Tax=Spirosoma radiotolerans TaxID=1379870 RepID=A0A0E4A049_9BACT|nr:TlpA family protein disulfide reductase [Spirosoma radiotolerans]AKD58285.1 alkyl hydroperoxide reductase [Spirosoma radiotolerans]